MDRRVERANRIEIGKLLIVMDILWDDLIGPLNPTIHEGLEWPLQLNSLYVLPILQIF